MKDKPAAPAEDPKPHHKKDKPEVYVLRDIKEYLGESVLIIFSVLLALFLTEYFNGLHEKNETKELLKNIKEELIKNKKAEEEQYTYQKMVLKNIDSALNNKQFQHQIIANDEFHLNLIAPAGIQYRDLSTVAWEVAKSKDIISKADFGLITKLTDIYAQQARIDKLEDKIADVFLRYESRRPENVHASLVLMRDNYKGWAFDRAPSLIAKYEDAIKMMSGD
ncbi:hypothetical protein [Mucilaginibacter ginsenosidivorans]|uniref:Uncharacterized protein n=1 Tax=Mucilaginibacter ginsenosidivorans TaxID=398053 RepID=A0A5B8UV47_9SPHI|nr:hypothetical protein [Mucilaginibacter ginsenosidivorans]QEC63010.1 hypothetical protein FRZ54_10605 [Mucilaginibacter ginsenosidivorans]